MSNEKVKFYYKGQLDKRYSTHIKIDISSHRDGELAHVDIFPIMVNMIFQHCGGNMFSNFLYWGYSRQYMIKYNVECLSTGEDAVEYVETLSDNWHLVFKLKAPFLNTIVITDRFTTIDNIVGYNPEPEE